MARDTWIALALVALALVVAAADLARVASP